MESLPEELKISDGDLFRRLAADPAVNASTPRLVETYGEYKDLHKEHTAWFKHYFIAGALLLASQFEVLEEMGFGPKVQKEFIPLAALLYMTASIIVFTNFELKMRVYRAVYDAELHLLGPSSRLVTMMRYPFAFFGTGFTAPFILHTHLISKKDFILGIPLLLALGLGRIIVAGAGLYATYNVFVQVTGLHKYGLMRFIVLAAFIAALIFSLATLRGIKRSHVYHEKRLDQFLL